MGRYCFIDDSCTDIMVKIPDNNDDAEIFHVYKASTGEYICPCTLQALCDALEIKVKASLVRAIDNFPLTKYNIYVSKECQDNIVPPKPVYEIFTENNNLVLSTFYPDNYKYWKPAGLQYNLNPYKPNHYMLKLPQNFNNVPAQPTVDYLQYPEKILLDNNES